MKRFHIHIGVDNLDEAIRFYSGLFGAEPVKAKSTVTVWLDDPWLTTTEMYASRFTFAPAPVFCSMMVFGGN